MRTEFLCISVLRVASGPRVKLASCKSALNPPVFALPPVLRRWSTKLTIFSKSLVVLRPMNYNLSLKREVCS